MLKRLSVIAMIILALGVMSCTPSSQSDLQPPNQLDTLTPPTQQQPAYNTPPAQRDYPQQNYQQDYSGIIQMYEDMANAADAEVDAVWDRYKSKRYDYSDPNWKLEALEDTWEVNREMERYRNQANDYREKANSYRRR